MKPDRSKSTGKSSRGRDRKRFIIYGEGDTELDYISHWGRLYRDSAIIITPRNKVSDPFNLVKLAREEKRKNTARRDANQDAEYWCIIDRDEHDYFSDALHTARDNGIDLAVSNPCIELWFVIHFEDQTAYIERSDVQSKARTLLGCNKRISKPALQLLEDGYDCAKERAQRLDDMHEGNDSPLFSNPSSGLWKLVDQIRNSG